MGFWNDGWAGRSRSPSSSSSSSPSRSRARSTRAASHTSASSKAYAAEPSFTRSASSFFGVGGGSQAGGHRGSTSSRARGSSYTSARSRPGFVNRVRRFLRQVYEWMRKHPFKVFFFVIMPLITGGVLTKLLATVGIRLPRSVESVLGSSMNRSVGQNERYYARGGARDYSGGTGLAGMGIGGNMGDNIQTALSIAKMFM